MRKLKANIFLEARQIPGFLLEFIYKYESINLCHKIKIHIFISYRFITCKYML